MTQQASLGFSKQAPFDDFRRVLRSSKNGGQEGETEHIMSMRLILTADLIRVYPLDERRM